MRPATGGVGPCWRIVIRGGDRVVAPIVDAHNAQWATRKAIDLALELIGQRELEVHPATQICLAGRHIGGGPE